MTLDVYTDGSCWNKCPHGLGGWAYCVVHPDDEDKLLEFNSGTLNNASSNRSEMRAVMEIIKVFSGLKGSVKVRIHSDSAYVVNCFLERWYEIWELNQYVGTSNATEWQELIGAVRQLRKDNNIVEFVKVKGHVGNRFNELVDKLAGEARLNGLAQIKGEKSERKAHDAAQRLVVSAEFLDG